MGNVRVYVLARELGISSAEMLERLKSDGHDVATASSSVVEDVAARYRSPGSAPAPARSRPKGGAKKGPQPAAAPPKPVLPPPPPIVKRAKAVKPTMRRPATDEERAVAEEARRRRLARLRGEEPEPAPAEPEAPVAPVVEAEPETVTGEPVPTEAAEPVAAPPEIETPAEPEPEVEEVAAEAPQVVEHAATAVAAGGASEAEEAPTPETPPERPRASTGPVLPRAIGRLELPKVVRPAPRDAEPAKATGEAAARPRPGEAAPRPTFEFRGPIGKIDLPQQPQRPAATPGRPSTAGITRTFSQRPGTGLGKQRKRKRKGGAAPTTPVQQVAPVKKGGGEALRLTEGVSVKELAEKMDVKAKDIIRILMQRGMMVTVNMALEPELASSLAEEFGYQPDVVSFEEEIQAQEDEAILENIEELGEEEPRPPVVTVMGHVDHGKTSLLDLIRHTNVAGGEAGGITQSIGAYQVEVQGKPITFVDTPGHEAFTSMRARGAQVTDIVVLVVAATDSVMPQTIEAINHARAAKVPVVVAINKIDLPNARPERVKTDLMNHGIVVEQFGGEVVTAEVSAVQGTGVPELLELLLLQAELLDLKATPTRRATGIVLEAGVDRGMGAVASVIIQDGSIRPGDGFIVGSEFGRVRALFDDLGERMEIAGPSTPVQVTGLNGVPNSGDRLQVVESEAQAKEISEFRQHKRREAEIAKSGPKATLQDLARAVAEGEAKELAVVVKADVHGAVEVLTKTIEDLATEKVTTKIIHSGTGAITDSDVLLATASDAIIVGFNVRPERSAADLADREKVIIRLHTVIYELIDELKGLMTGLLDVIKEEEFLGRAEVRETFKVPRVGMVAGCYVQDGKVVRNANARLVRDGVVLWEGRMSSLKRFKEDAREVPAGMECGIGLEDYNDVKVGDAIEAFNIKEVRPTLE